MLNWSTDNRIEGHRHSAIMAELYESHLIELDDKKEKHWINKSCPNMQNVVLPIYCKTCGQHYAKDLHCTKPYCSVCGQVNSMPHLRRQGRMLPKYYQMGAFKEGIPIGQAVFTLPDEIQNYFKMWKKHRQKFEIFTRNLIHTIFNYDKDRKMILNRHFGGDAKLDESKEKPSGEWAYHQHWLIEIKAGENPNLPTEKLDEIRGIITKYWHDNYKYLIKNIKDVIPDSNWHWSFAHTVKRKMHLLRYCSRATMRWREPEVEKTIHRARTYLYYGKWDKNVTIIDVLNELNKTNPNKMDRDKLGLIDKFFVKRECMFCNGTIEYSLAISIRHFYLKYKHYARGTPVANGLWVSEVSESYADYYEAKKNNLMNPVESENEIEHLLPY